MLDGYGRNIDYARISLTDKCNLRCVYCMPEDKVYENNLINDTLSFNDYKFIINGLSQVGIKKIKFTGGEPLLYPHLIELIKYAHYECNIDDISITTNGIGLNEIAYELKRSGLKSVNISLDSLKSYKYKSITRGGNLTDVLKSINRCLELGIKVKINCVVIKRFNDDEVYDFIEMANYYPIDVRFIELMPLGEGEYFYENGYFNISKLINDIDELYKIEDEKGSTARLYQAKYAKGRIGIITPISCKFCNTCNRIRITSDGKIKLCLHSNEETDIRYYLNKPMIFKEVLKEIILKKPDKHNLLENNSSDTYRQMYEIGG
ncbi:GTP 3',8-cyclase MoaA [Romboutsia timonensis]|uniref:GTP 3',8-cyclase MoaA n=1 Tax=Romboutsia timonensis TaxID=1776391 RepID=UPI002A753303|nr:GTP 3',8-cyclase MoaA [Romboutsia timonensis]MDY3001668.1 GTP 3',8-cyclase MoaA [Romboutsia timonensis]MDY3959759.1 GTP 3',8-cyclase MoaA [Romboutsia timonensis]